MELKDLGQQLSNTEGLRASLQMTYKDQMKNINPMEENVEVDLTAGDFISGENCIIWSGPPTLDLAISNQDMRMLKSVGLATNVSIQQANMFIPWEEFGQSYDRFLPTKTSVGLSISRVRSNHNSFSYAAYRWFIDLVNRSSLTEKALGIGDSSSKDRLEFISYPTFIQERVVNSKDKGKQAFDIANRHWENIRSEFFLFPFGLMIAELDHWMNVVTCFYFENCKITNASKLLNDNPLSLENIQILCQNKEPAIGINLPNIQKKIFKMKDEIGDALKQIKTV